MDGLYVTVMDDTVGICSKQAFWGKKSGSCCYYYRRSRLPIDLRETSGREIESPSTGYKFFTGWIKAAWHSYGRAKLPHYVEVSMLEAITTYLGRWVSCWDLSSEARITRTWDGGTTAYNFSGYIKLLNIT